MNPIVRHFLPSVVRGVYRYDDELGKIEDDSSHGIAGRDAVWMICFRPDWC
ncbi:MAG: hypothetical protein HY360_24145 [Verrucomicrobia bacterium]|nr:hypothetical protein [Verrucomicrobiota bacterium]